MAAAAAVAARVDAIIMWSAQPERLCAFYRALGLSLELEDHGDGGPPHWSCELDGGVHLAVFAAQAGGVAPARRGGGCTQASFRVRDLEAAVAALVAAGAPVLIERQAGPWGVRVVVQDPDGRPVQVTAAA